MPSLLPLDHLAHYLWQSVIGVEWSPTNCSIFTCSRRICYIKSRSGKYIRMWRHLIHTHAYARTYTHMCMHTHKYMCNHTHANIHIHTHTCTHMCMHTHTHNTNTDTHTRAHTHTHTHTHTIHTCI